MIWKILESRMSLTSQAAIPKALYDEHCRQREVQVDRCVLYVFRCAVYYANNTVHDPELLKWWNWKDRDG